MITLERVSVQRGSFVIADLSLTIATGSYGLLVGRSGSGKTSLLDAIAGHLPLTQGRILLGDRDITALPAEERSIGLVYQHYHLFPHLSVRENIAYGLRRSPPEERTSRVTHLSDALRLGNLLDRYPRHLSGGEQQLVAVARAIAPRPTVLLLDEPFAALDPISRHHLREAIAGLHRSEAMTTLQVTHDFGDAVRLGDMVAILDQGQVVQQGTPEKIVSAPTNGAIAQLVEAGNVIQGVVAADTSLSPPDTPISEPPFVGRFTAGQLSLEVITSWVGPAHAIIRPEDILVGRDPFPGYPRNRFRARVERSEQRGPVVMLWIDAGVVLRAAVTQSTAVSLDLHPGDEVFVGLKTTAVRLVKA